MDILLQLWTKEIVISFTITIITIIGLTILHKFYQRLIKTLNPDYILIVRTVYDFTNISIIILIGLTVLQINGIDVSSLLAGLGVASVILGLALQDIIKDIIMGIRIMTDKFFTIGDVVQYNNEEGVVIAFNIRRTKIESIKDHDVMTISNRNISEIVVSSTLNDIDLPLSYEDDLSVTLPLMETIVERIKAEPNIIDCVFKGINSYDSSAIIYKIRFFCPPEIRYDMRRTCNGLIKQILEEHNIHIPFNQLDVHMKSQS